MKPCFWCAAPSTRRCEKCEMGIYFCSPQHLRYHRSETGDDLCLGFKVKTSGEAGRFLVAARDFAPFELVFAESPLVIGPSLRYYARGGRGPTKGRPREERVIVCLECLKPIEGQISVRMKKGGRAPLSIPFPFSHFLFRGSEYNWGGIFSEMQNDEEKKCPRSLARVGLGSPILFQLSHFFAAFASCEATAAFLHSGLIFFISSRKWSRPKLGSRKWGAGNISGVNFPVLLLLSLRLRRHPGFLRVRRRRHFDRRRGIGVQTAICPCACRVRSVIQEEMDVDYEMEWKFWPDNRSLERTLRMISILFFSLSFFFSSSSCFSAFLPV